MDKQDIKRLKEIAGVLGSALNEVQGLLEKYKEPQPPPSRTSRRQERIEKYRYKFLSGQMRKRKT
jgi:hypothetical protein